MRLLESSEGFQEGDQIMTYAHAIFFLLMYSGYVTLMLAYEFWWHGTGRAMAKKMDRRS